MGPKSTSQRLGLLGCSCRMPQRQSPVRKWTHVPPPSPLHSATPLFCLSGRGRPLPAHPRPSLPLGAPARASVDTAPPRTSSAEVMKLVTKPSTALKLAHPAATWFFTTAAPEEPPPLEEMPGLAESVCVMDRHRAMALSNS